jgi:hypothetical protein
VPNPLPPSPSLELDGEIQGLIQNAMLALGRLDGLTTVLPNPAIFLYSYVRKLSKTSRAKQPSRPLILQACWVFSPSNSQVETPICFALLHPAVL